MRRVAGVVVVGWLTVSACLHDDLVPCGPLLCPVGTVCTVGGCASQEAAEACSEKLDLDPCVLASVDSDVAGTCSGGSCHPIACGNGVKDPDEACDDGNTSYRDGCSADCRSDETCGNGVPDPILDEQCDVGVSGLSGDGCTSRCSFEIEIWRDVTPAPLPPTNAAGLVFDAARGVMVLFGGFNAAFSDQTWEWNDISWRRRVVRDRPGGRTNVSLAYDANRRRTVMFGGETLFATRFGDTWEWDGVQWLDRTPAVSPPARSFTSLAYDPVRKRVVVFGGFGVGSPVGDTWEWDGTTWTEHVVAGPSARAGASFSFDPILGKLLLFGGYDGATLQDTWTWDGQVWAPLSPAAKPPVRYGAASATCGAQIVVFGGSGTLSGTQRADTWTWNGTTWTQIGGAAPPARTTASLAYDSLRSMCILVGGGAGAAFDDTWQLAGGAWTQRTLEWFPAARVDHGLAYDALRGRSVLFGGRAAGAATADTWEWDGASWLRMLPVTLPPARTMAALVFDEQRKTVMLFGGGAGAAGDDFWEWNGLDWKPVASPVPRPPVRQLHSMAYDRDRDRVIVFGGNVAGLPVNDIWEWDGTTWADVTPTTGVSPSARRGAAFVYDPIKHRSILIAGSDAAGDLKDVWEWDGTTWTPGGVNAALPPRNRAAATYDAVRQRVVVFGGVGFLGGTLDQTLEYASALEVRSPPLVPIRRGGAALAYDAIHHRTVLASGANPDGALADTWTRAFESSDFPPEDCISATEDTDGDGKVGCDDADCFGRCTPLCPPGASCDLAAPHCGDGQCGAVEDYLICPGDCPVL